MLNGFFAVFYAPHVTGAQAQQQVATEAYLASVASDVVLLGQDSGDWGRAYGYKTLAPVALPPAVLAGQPLLLPLWVVDAVGATKPLSGIAAANDTYQQRALRAEQSVAQSQEISDAMQAAVSSAKLSQSAAKVADAASKKANTTGLLSGISGAVSAIVLLGGVLILARAT